VTQRYLNNSTTYFTDLLFEKNNRSERKLRPGFPNASIIIVFLLGLILFSIPAVVVPIFIPLERCGMKEESLSMVCRFYGFCNFLVIPGHNAVPALFNSGREYYGQRDGMTTFEQRDSTSQISNCMFCEAVCLVRSRVGGFDPIVGPSQLRKH
jgi:hypothetical protein